MRVATFQLYGSLTASLDNALENIQNSQSQLSSGLRLTKPSDSPTDAASILSINISLSENIQYSGNVSLASQKLGDASANVSYIVSALQNAKSLVVSANSSIGATGLSGLADQTEGIINGVLGAVNSSSGSQSLFGGTSTVGTAFSATMGADPDGVSRIQSVSYQGDHGAANIAVSSSQNVAVTQDGSQLMQTGPGGVFETLISIRQAMASGSAPSQALQNALDSQINRLIGVNAQLGASQQQLTSQSTLLSSQNTTLTAQRSTLQDTNFAAESLLYQTQQLTYQASLYVASKTSQQSLIQYL